MMLHFVSLNLNFQIASQSLRQLCHEFTFTHGIRVKNKNEFTFGNGFIYFSIHLSLSITYRYHFALKLFYISIVDIICMIGNCGLVILHATLGNPA